jgi:SAM-dependent methyltransferase
MTAFPESRLAHSLLDGLTGIEIGESACNRFGLRTWNVSNEQPGGFFHQAQLRQCGAVARIDVVAYGEQLPFADSSLDFVVSSHVFEHLLDPIAGLWEWHRVIRPGGLIYMIVPHKFRTFDLERPRTPLGELIGRHEGTVPLPTDMMQHASVWITEDVVELVGYLGWEIVAVQDTDDKAGNGFAVAVKVAK